MSDYFSKPNKLVSAIALSFFVISAPFVSYFPANASSTPSLKQFSSEQLNQIKQNAIKHYHGAALTTRDKNGKIIINAGGPAGTPPLTYVGGSTGKMMHTSKTYLIFWKPSGYNFDTNYESNIIAYYEDIASISTPLYKVATQYYDNINGHFSNGISYGGYSEDTTAFPTSGQCTDYATPSGCVTETQIQSEIKTVVSAKGWSTGYTTNYLLFTPIGIGSSVTNNGQTAFAYDTQNGVAGFCGFHNSSFISTSHAYLYGVIPDPNLNLGTQSQPNYPCEPISQSNAPTDVNSDNAISTSSHEHFETITNPDPTNNLGIGPVWVTSDGYEIGDLCAATYGAGLPFHPLADVVINNDYYEVQEEYSNFVNTGSVRTGCTLTPGSGQMMTGSVYTLKSGSGNNEIDAYNTSDGTSRWSYSSGTLNPVTTPVESNGNVFFVDGNTGQLRSINASTGVLNTTVYNLNGATGAVVDTTTSPYVNGNNIYIGMNDSTGIYVEAFATNCSTCNDLWKISIQNSIYKQVTIFNNVLYVPENNVDIEAFDLTQNPPTRIWDDTLAPGNNVTTSVQIDANGIMYYGDFQSLHSSRIVAVLPTNTGGTWSFPQQWVYLLSGTPDSLNLSSNNLYLTSACWDSVNSVTCGTNIDGLKTGSTLANKFNRVNVTDTDSGSPIVLSGAAVYFSTQNGVYSYLNYNNPTPQRWHVLAGNSYNQIYTTNGNTFVGGSTGILDLNNTDGSARVGITSNSSLALNLSLNDY